MLELEPYLSPIPVFYEQLLSMMVSLEWQIIKKSREIFAKISPGYQNMTQQTDLSNDFFCRQRIRTTDHLLFQRSRCA